MVFKKKSGVADESCKEKENSRGNEVRLLDTKLKFVNMFLKVNFLPNERYSDIQISNGT